ncbi:uncharacterized protein LOC129217587 [Uloborus diversus]|uniref:uncharacterized protein LOC129217587 n=1 Tax=Uloborus diversus TaxID=327109 RepID=UPI0024095768|nr:uncharacterized protein LOC129217587 [Uloborus diversus]
MILAIVLLFCSCATLKASEYPAYYVSEYSEPRYVEYQQDGYGDNYGEEEEGYGQSNLKKYHKSQQNYGDKYGEDYDQGGQRKFQKSQEKYGAGQYEDEQAEALRDFANHQAHNSGAKASLQSNGGEKGHVSNAYDRGNYKKEKKYGYEKAYGYEKESKNQDSKAVSQSFAKGYNHDENKANFNEQEFALKDLAAKNRKQKSGHQSEGAKDYLLDLNERINRGKKYGAKYGNQNNDQEIIQYVQQPLHVYKSYKRPIYLKSYIPEGRIGYDGYVKNRYFPGFSGLGGLRGYGMEYEMNPYLNGYSGYSDDFLFAGQGYKKPLINSYGNSYGKYVGYFSKSDI